MATLTIELPAHVTQGQMLQALESLGCDLRLSRDGRNYMAVPKTKVAQVSLSTMQRQASLFRQQYDKTHSGGYVVFFKGRPVSWCKFLDRPEAQEPGCIAMDDKGNQWVAAGGDSYNGALRWEAVSAPISSVTRMPARLRQVRQPGTA